MMHITLDTNVFGPLFSPEEYQNHPADYVLAEIAHSIAQEKVKAYISEASLSLEALDRHVRIDSFFREWAARHNSITLPQPHPTRCAVVERTFAAGVNVLQTQRIALGSFIEVPSSAWAPDTRFSQQERQARESRFVRDYPTSGPQRLKVLGAELVSLHGIDVSRVLRFPGWPPPEELLWLKGIVAEYDQPRRFDTAELFSRHIRDLIAEWTDIDILASHYGYGLDVFCTLDTAGNTGASGILHPNNRSYLHATYGIDTVSPLELVDRMSKCI